MNMRSHGTINIKQLIYRSTIIFIAALASKQNIFANSSFDVIEEMFKKDKVTQYSAFMLRYAIAIACEMSLKVYTEKNSQCNNVVSLNQNDIQNFLNIVGVASTIDYF